MAFIVSVPISIAIPFPMPRFTNGLYFWICKRNFSVEGDEGSIFSKAPDWQSLFKIKTEQTQGCPNKQYNVFFKHINQNVMIYPRRNFPEVFCKKDVYGNFAKCTGKHLCQSLFFNTATLLKKRLWHRYFPVNFAKFRRTRFLTQHLWWLLLYTRSKKKLHWSMIRKILLHIGRCTWCRYRCNLGIHN